MLLSMTQAQRALNIECGLDFEMTDSKNGFHKAIEGIVGGRTREATRQIGHRFEHLLIGSVTKRPN